MMPKNVIRSKQKYAELTDAEFANKFSDKTEDQLRQMARRHGYNDNDHYLNRVKKGSKLKSSVDTI